MPASCACQSVKASRFKRQAPEVQRDAGAGAVAARDEIRGPVKRPAIREEVTAPGPTLA